MTPKTVGPLSHRVFFILSIQFLIGFNHLRAQEIKGDTIPNTILSAQVDAPFVYIDCQDCDHNFIRTELSFVH